MVTKVLMARNTEWVPVEIIINGDEFTTIWKWGQEALNDVDNWDRSFRTSIERGIRRYMNARHRNIPIIFYFSNEQDAVHFKMVWG